jgi:hypothetical protein
VTDAFILLLLRSRRPDWSDESPAFGGRSGFHVQAHHFEEEWEMMTDNNGKMAAVQTAAGGMERAGWLSMSDLKGSAGEDGFRAGRVGLGILRATGHPCGGFAVLGSGDPEIPHFS